MRERKKTAYFILTLSALLLAGQTVILAQGAGAKQISKDEVYFSIARRINAVSESPVTAIVAEVDGLIEVTGIALEPGDLSVATVREKTPSSAAYTQKTIRLKFKPSAEPNKWDWVEFEENRRFYPVDKLFPYAKDQLAKRRQMVDAKWTAFIDSIGKQADAANKALETAKAVIKSDPPPLQTLTPTRANLTQAMKDKDNDAILGAFAELGQQSESIHTLADSHPDLKANDAYLRLNEEYKNSIKVTDSLRKDYVKAVEAYNENLLRLPFALVAYGMQFTKIEPIIAAE